MNLTCIFNNYSGIFSIWSLRSYVNYIWYEIFFSVLIMEMKILYLFFNLIFSIYNLLQNVALNNPVYLITPIINVYFLYFCLFYLRTFIFHYIFTYYLLLFLFLNVFCMAKICFFLNYISLKVPKILKNLWKTPKCRKFASGLRKAVSLKIKNNVLLLD